MDIAKLKRKRQLNVHEQNALAKHAIFTEASYWRKNGIPQAIKLALESHGICAETSIFLKYAQNFPGISTDEGMVLTQEKRFYEFEIDRDSQRAHLISFHALLDVTASIEINEHKPGTGATWGFLALEVLAELNRCQ